MTEYDFSGLTCEQYWLLTCQGWTVESRIPPKPTEDMIKPLIERGLLIEYESKKRDIIVKEYEVPIDVHIAWCRYCSGKVN